MVTRPMFYEKRLKRYHDPLGLPSRTDEDQGERSPPRNKAESSGQPGLPVSKPVNETQAGTHVSHTKGYDGTEWEELGSWSSADNAPMELMSLKTKSVQVLAKDLKGPRLASLRGSLTTRSKPKGYLDRIDAISKLTDLVA
ncbi:Hypothetical protein PHPALM_11152 [Phytophthora palmivora]|uniref:Uncharacterized protein n=1 Tax=Phytophthora palmivora TaxID=4796 RepID=A0A2P4Y2Y6_9STRA|nr:Hypothetical protein PHPALM_11152 [Phytophthora palmivora]